MTFAAQLDVDAETNAHLDQIAERLDRITGLETVKRIGDVHHVGLGVYDDLAVDAFVADLERVVETVEAVPIRIANVGVFPGEKSVVYLGPVVTEPLLALHRRFHDALSAHAGSCCGYYLPGAWVPHVTLAMDAEPGALEEAVETLRQDWQPRDARLDAMRLIRFRPVETLHLQALPDGGRRAS